MTQFSPFSFITPSMVQTLPRKAGTVPFHTFVNMKHVSAHKGMHIDGHDMYYVYYIA